MPERFERGKTQEQLNEIKQKSEEERAQKIAQQQQIAKSRLGLEGAQEEANMVRAAAGVSPESGKIRVSDEEKSETTFSKRYRELDQLNRRESKPEDYDEALKAVEDMKRLAAEEPSAKKIFNLLGRMGERARYLVVSTMMLPLNVMSMITREPSTKIRNEKHDEIMEHFTDAEKRLKDLKKQAAKFEKQK